MLYRVHRPNNPDGSLGNSIGYVHLCHGHVTIQHICSVLSESNLIPNKWFRMSELQLGQTHSQVYGIFSYTVLRKTPKSHLYYLCPVDVGLKTQTDGYTVGTTLTFGGATSVAHWNNAYFAAEPIRVVRAAPIGNYQVYHQAQMGNHQPVVPPADAPVDPAILDQVREVQERIRLQREQVAAEEDEADEAFFNDI